MGSQDEFLAVYNSDRAVQRTVPDGGTWFWYDSRDALGTLYRAVASFYLWLPRYIGADFPNLEDATPPGHLPIAVLSKDENAFQKAAAAFRAKGRETRFLSETKIDSGTIHFTITFIDVSYLTLTF